MRLFVDRAQAVRPDFQVTWQNAAALAALCRKLEGLPLALELAAARAGVLTPTQMLARLQHRFELLAGRQQDVSSRHRSLWAALDWSYRLLSPPLQRFFAHLSVFRGGFTLEAAEAVCFDCGLRAVSPADDGSVCADEGRRSAPREFTLDRGLSDQDERGSTPSKLSLPGNPQSAIRNPQSSQSAIRNPLDRLEQLRECSLVLAEEAAEGIRFRLLETLREYGAEQLAAEERAALAQRHLDYFLALAEAAAPELQRPAAAEWLARLEREHDNLRAALDWALEQAPEQALRLGAALAGFWEEWRYLEEGRRRLAAILARAGNGRRSLAGAAALAGTSALAARQDDHLTAHTLLEESLAIRRELGDRAGIAATLAHHAHLALRRDEYPAARALYNESLALYQELEDQAGVATVLSDLGNVACYQGQHAEARVLLEESLAIRRALGDRYGIAQSLIHLGDFFLDQGDGAAARACFTEALSIGRELGDRSGVAGAVCRLGNAAQEQGDYAEARRLNEEGLALWRAIGCRVAVVHSLGGLGHLARKQGEYSDAWAFYRESLLLRRELGETYVIAQSLEDFAELAACEREWLRLARLLGAARALREAIGKPLLPRDHALYNDLLTAARGALGEAAIAAAWAEGQTMTLEQSVGLGLEEDHF